jgi:hypothetical protein
MLLGGGSRSPSSEMYRAARRANDVWRRSLPGIRSESHEVPRRSSWGVHLLAQASGERSGAKERRWAVAIPHCSRWKRVGPLDEKGREEEMQTLSAALTAQAPDRWSLHSLEPIPVFGSITHKEREGSCRSRSSNMSRRVRKRRPPWHPRHGRRAHAPRQGEHTRSVVRPTAPGARDEDSDGPAGHDWDGTSWLGQSV